MAAPTASSVFDLIAHQEVTHPNSVLDGTVRSPAGIKIEVYIWIYHAFIEAAANTNAGSIYIQTRPAASNDQWVDVAQFRTFTGTPVIENLTATEPIGETVMTVGSTTGFVADDNIYIQDVGTATNSEWHKCDLIVTNTSIDLVSGLVVQKDTSDNIFSDAESWAFPFRLPAITDYRAIYKHEGTTGANTAIWVQGREWETFA